MKHSYLIMGSHNPNTAERISAFSVPPSVIEEIAKEWRRQFPYVSYVAIKPKHSIIYFESEEEV